MNRGYVREERVKKNEIIILTLLGAALALFLFSPVLYYGKVGTEYITGGQILYSAGIHWGIRIIAGLLMVFFIGAIIAGCRGMERYFPRLLYALFGLFCLLFIVQNITIPPRDYGWGAWLSICCLTGVAALVRGKLYLLTPVLVFLSFPSYDVWILGAFPFFAWFALVPLFMDVRGRELRNVYSMSFIAGLIGYGMTYKWIGAFGAKIPGGYLFIVFMLIPVLSLFFSTGVFLAEFFSRRFERFRVLIYPAVWIFMDWVQSIGFLSFPISFWGHSQYPFTSFIQISAFTGVMGVSFILILFNSLVADWLCRMRGDGISIRNAFRMKEFRPVAALVLAVLLISGIGKIILLSNETSGKGGLRVAMIQSCISPWEDWNGNRFRYLRTLIDYTDRAMKEKPGLIVWSEYATLELISHNYRTGKLDLFEQTVLDVARLNDTPLITGEIGILEDKINGRQFPQNTAAYINRKGEVVDSYAKIHLVPFGEWFPYNRLFPSIQRLALRFGGSMFVPGDEPLLFTIEKRRFGCLICYEGIFFRLCREYRKRGADFLINITNDGWTDTYSGHMQHFAASVFRAVENGLWYVRDGNTGFTALIDPLGRITGSIPILKKGYLAGGMDFSLNRDTFYTRFGDIFLYMVLVANAIMFIMTLAGYAKKRRAMKG